MSYKYIQMLIFECLNLVKMMYEQLFLKLIYEFFI